MTKFSWIPTYKGIVNYLQSQKGNQAGLIKLLKSLGIEGFVDQDSSGNKIELEEIDPFTFFCYLNKFGSERRIELYAAIAKELDLPIPTDDSGLPSADARKVHVFPFKKDRNSKEIDRLWDLFFSILGDSVTDEQFEDILSIKGTGKVKITELFFYVDPQKYFPLNGPSIPYLEKKYGINTSFNSFSEYNNILEKLRGKTSTPFYEISAMASNDRDMQKEKLAVNEPKITVGKSNSNSVKYWMYAPGAKAKYWKEFYSKGLMALGWDELDDLNEYESQKELAKVIQEFEGTSKNKNIDALANIEFRDKVAIGDIIFVKRGRKELIGYGVVKSDYYYDSERPYYYHCRDVEWILNGSWETDFDLPLKTLTDVSEYKTEHPDYEFYFQRVMGLLNSNGQQLMKIALNTILYGPPGTGKTYNSIKEAVRIVNPGFDISQEWSTVKKEYDRLVEAKQIVFTTFHQSMNYEDFVEGIKPQEPKEEGQSVTYKIEDGVFKQVCKRANPVHGNFDNVIEAFKKDISEDDGKEPLTIKGKGTTFDVKFKGTLVFYVQPHASTKEKPWYPVNIANIEKAFTTGNYDGVYNPTYVREIISYLEKNKGLKNGKNNGEERENYVLIIDEINRGNVSSIFGELITLIEENKRLGNHESITVTLPYSKKEFGVPKNLYIIGTMNTADRSVEALDTALRRRFTFTEMPPQPELIITAGNKVDNVTINGTGINLIDILKTINSRIELLLDQDHLIGHSFFIKVKDETSLRSAIGKEIIPLMQEYFYGDYGKIALVLGEGFCKGVKKDKPASIFAKVNDYDVDGYSDRVIYEIKDPAAKRLDDNSYAMSSDEFKNALTLLLNK